jgi:V8-like Glu-specific endopeptidase
VRLALFLLATAAGAQDIPAVGRITFSATLAPGAAVCSGTLVAPDLVLTAAHCVRGSVDTPSVVHFAAGYRDGTAAATGQGAAITLARGSGLQADVAVVRLQSPLPVHPLPIGPETDPWLMRMGYRRDAPEQPDTDTLCLRVHEEGRVVQLLCDAVSGHSGAPLLSRGPEGNWRVAAVMVATFNAGIGSVAVRVPPDLADLLPASK